MNNYIFPSFAEIIRDYDIRGVFGVQLLEEHAYIIGEKFANYVDNDSLVIGHDSRYSSKILRDALFSGLKKTGCKIYDIGMCSSPMLNFAHKFFVTKGAIMITASHNPIRFNGFKLFKDFLPLSKEEMHYFLKNITPKGDKKASIIYRHDILFPYIKYLTKDSAQYNIVQKLKIIWDCAHCVSSKIVNMLKLSYPFHEHIVINDIIDEYSCADNSNVENFKPLIRAVKDNNADVGFYFDTDADRISVIDKNGNVVLSESIMMLLIEDRLNKKKQCKKIILDYQASNVLILFLKHRGIDYVFCRTGHSFIRKAMMEEGADLAGEGSGHIFFGTSEHDDGICVAAKIIDIFSENKTFDALPKIYMMPEKRIDSINATLFVKNIANKLFQDKTTFIATPNGMKIILVNGWCSIRASGTENKIVLKAEGVDPLSLSETINYLQDIIIDIV